MNHGLYIIQFNSCTLHIRMCMHVVSQAIYTVYMQVHSYNKISNCWKLLTFKQSLIYRKLLTGNLDMISSKTCKDDTLAVCHIDMYHDI